MYRYLLWARRGGVWTGPSSVLVLSALSAAVILTADLWGCLAARGVLHARDMLIVSYIRSDRAWGGVVPIMNGRILSRLWVGS